MTLLVVDVVPAIGGCSDEELAALRQACGLNDGDHPGALAASALLTEIATDDRLLRPIGGPLAGWIASDEKVADQKLGTLLPDLVRATGAVVEEEFSPKTFEVLSARDASVWSALARTSPSELAGWHGMTHARVEEVVAISLREAAVQSLRLAPRTSSRAEVDLTTDVATVGAWASAGLGLHTLGEALATLPEALGSREQAAGVPEEVAAAWERIVEAPLRPLAGSRGDRYDVRRALDRLLTLDAPMDVIVRQRLYPAGKKRTLDELGQALGVTRERVRQIEKRARGILQDRLEDPAFGAITRAAVRLRLELGRCVAFDSLPVEITRALTGEPAPDEDEDVAMRLLMELAGPYEAFERWLVRAPARELVTATTQEIEEVMDSGSLAQEVAARILAANEVPEAEQAAWLELACKCRTIEDRVVSWRGSMADKTERLLAISGDPMTVEEIAAIMGEGTNMRSLLMQIQGGSRFLRRGKKHYGLSAWGGEEYTTIQEEIAQEIERQGGKASLQHLIDTLCAQFGVSENSVRAYASDVPFVRLTGGEIAIGTSDTRKFAPRSMAQTRDCFRVDGHWALRFVVDRDVLRGSGRPVSVAVMQHLGLAPGGEAKLAFPDTEVALRWGRQPSMGSLRAVAQQHGCEDGDLLFVRFLGDLRADSRRMARSTLEGSSGLARLAVEVGVDSRDDDLVPHIARALDLEHDDATLSGIRRRLRSRQEDDLVDLAPDQEGDDTAHDEVLKQILGLG